jgi:hypothetical protein
MGILSVCQRLYVHFNEGHHETCIRSKPSDKVGKIAKSSTDGGVQGKTVEGGVVWM